EYEINLPFITADASAEAHSEETDAVEARAAYGCFVPADDSAGESMSEGCESFGEGNQRTRARWRDDADAQSCRHGAAIDWQGAAKGRQPRRSRRSGRGHSGRRVARRGKGRAPSRCYPANAGI